MSNTRISPLIIVTRALEISDIIRRKKINRSKIRLRDLRDRIMRIKNIKRIINTRLKINPNIPEIIEGTKKITLEILISTRTRIMSREPINQETTRSRTNPSAARVHRQHRDSENSPRIRDHPTRQDNSRKIQISSSSKTPDTLRIGRKTTRTTRRIEARTRREISRGGSTISSQTSNNTRATTKKSRISRSTSQEEAITDSIGVTEIPLETVNRN